MIIREDDGRKIKLTIIGKLDVNTSPELRTAVQKIPDDIDFLTLDMDNVIYISSAGFRELLTIVQRFTEKRLKILSVSEDLMESFRMVGFDSILPIEQAAAPEKEYLSLADFLREKARTAPDIPVLQNEREIYTWKEIDRVSQVLAGELSERGITKGTHVGLIALNSVNFVCYFYAIQKLGAMAVIMNYSSLPEEIAKLSAEGDVKALLVGTLGSGTPFSTVRELMNRELPEVDVIPLRDREDLKPLMESYPAWASRFMHRAQADDVTVMIFTSGSTGRSKGVLLSAYNLLNAATESQGHQQLNETDVCFNILPLFHVFGLVAGLLASAIANARLFLPSDLHTSAIIERIERWKCTVFHAVPTMFLAILANRDFTPEKLASLRCSIISGTAATESQLKSFRQALPGDHFMTSYGLSEMAPVSITAYEDTAEHLINTAGVPMSQIDLRIVSLSDGHLCAPMEEGEIRIQGFNLMTGYYKRDLSDQSIDRDGWLHTGDIGWLYPDGYLHISGRLKEIIIRGGENIMPMEVAQAITAWVPGVQDVKVVGVPDSFYGEKVAACVVMKEGCTLDEGQANAILAQKISRFKIPSCYFVFDSFPLLANGKPDAVTIKKEAVRRAASDMF